MKNVLSTLMLVLVFSFAIAQTGEKYSVAQTIKMRSGPGTEFNVIATLPEGEVVSLLEKNASGWWHIDFKGNGGYVPSQYLKPESALTQDIDDWVVTTYQSGETPGCENFTPEFDFSLENYLLVNIGANADVIIKLMKIIDNSEKCIRIVYVKSSESYKIKNIPEGRYSLKIAYGKDYRYRIENNICQGKFMKNALYEKGSDILDFNKIRKPDTKEDGYIIQNWDIPIFELFLDVRIDETDTDNFNSSPINEAEFNK
jgi:uncharacterized protein YgiM (DUF1202 family)